MFTEDQTFSGVFYRSVDPSNSRYIDFDSGPLSPVSVGGRDTIRFGTPGSSTRWFLVLTTSLCPGPGGLTLPVLLRPPVSDSPCLGPSGTSLDQVGE